MFHSAKLIVVLSVLCGCASSSSDSPSHTNGNGVNDVKLACEVRSTWTKATSNACLSCLALAPIPLCECQESNPLAARCNAQDAAKRAEPDCDVSVKDCVSACGEDCACADACFNTHAACKSVSAALDGCMAEVCHDSCK